MKEFSIEEKAKLYDEAIERAHFYKENTDRVGAKDVSDLIEGIFPELKESEDERIRNMLIEHMERWHKCALENNVVQDIKDSAYAITWLEKQGEKVIDCPQNHQDVKHPNGGIVLEDFNGGEGFYKLNLDYLNKKQVEEIEELVRMWNAEKKELKKIEQNPTWSEEDERIYKVILEILNSWSKGTIGGEIITPNTDKYINWFKSIKNKVQPKPAWSEEDERIYKSITYAFAHNYPLTVQQQEFVIKCMQRR